MITQTTKDSGLLSETELEAVTGGNWLVKGLLWEGAMLIGEAVYEAMTNPRPAPYNVQPDGFVG